MKTNTLPEARDGVGSTNIDAGNLSSGLTIDVSSADTKFSHLICSIRLARPGGES